MNQNLCLSWDLSKPASTPIDTNIKLISKEYDDNVSKNNHKVNDPPTNLQVTKDLQENY